MADNLTPEQRRRNMQHIRSKDTKPEILLRKALWRKGYQLEGAARKAGYRYHKA